MFHGVKKSEVKKLTPEEEKKNEEMLKKIKVIQDKIIQIKNEKKYDEKTMSFLMKAAKLLSDFPTLWNVRKILIEQFMEQSNEDEIYNFFLKEIERLFPIMKSDPKSYILWYHRIWCLIKIIEIEIKRNIPLDKSILMGEIALCNKFFLVDDRNFHCWNYRVQILTLICNYYNNTFDKFIEKELDFTLEKVKNNFSNFSAWSYRTKLIPIYFIQKNIKWSNKEALDFFKNDLELIKKAIYTDPKDQSPWNYHHWIITNFSPIFIQSVDILNNEIINIKYSNVFKIHEVIDINGNQGEYELLNKEEFSDTISIKISSNLNNKIIIKNKIIDKINFGTDHLSLVTNKICFTKENISLPTISIYMNEEKKLVYSIEMDNTQDFQINFLKEQVEFCEQLLKESSDFFIEYAHVRLAQINEIFYQITRRKDKEKAQDFQNKELSEYKLLSEKSKRMSNMYKTIYESIKK
jgi:geranylgeranyl transferase type-2 subunit alpha